MGAYTSDTSATATTRVPTARPGAKGIPLATTSPWEKKRAEGAQQPSLLKTPTAPTATQPVVEDT